MSWTDQAECRGMDMALFFDCPNGKYSAKAVSACRRCPVAQECLEDALANPETQGLWAGTGVRERDRIRRVRPRVGL